MLIILYSQLRTFAVLGTQIPASSNWTAFCFALTSYYAMCQDERNSTCPLDLHAVKFVQLVAYRYFDDSFRSKVGVHSFLILTYCYCRTLLWPAVKKDGWPLTWKAMVARRVSFWIWVLWRRLVCARSLSLFRPPLLEMPRVYPYLVRTYLKVTSSLNSYTRYVPLVWYLDGGVTCFYSFAVHLRRPSLKFLKAAVAKICDL